MTREAPEEFKLTQVFLIAVLFSFGMSSSEILDVGMLTGKSMNMSDTDTWLRLVLVKQLAMGEGWYNHMIARLDPPVGMVSPWTRPVDMLLLLLSSPFIPFMGLQEGLVYGALLYSQLLMLASVALLIKLYERMNAAPLGLLTCMFIFLFGPMIFSYFSPKNADHHSLLIFLAILSLSVADSWTRGGQRRLLLLLGFTLGLGIWVSVEFLAFAALVGGWVLLFWMSGRMEARHLVQFTCVLAGTVGIAWLLEQPPSTRWEVHFDALSLPYLALLLAMAIAGQGLAVAERFLPSTRSRVMAAVLLYGAAAGAVLTCFPLLPQGPLAETTPFMREHFLAQVIEMQPLFHGNPFLGSCYVLLMLVALGLVWKRWREGVLDRMTLLHALLAFFFLLQALLHRRVYYYGIPSTALLVGAALGEWLALRALHDGAKALIAVGVGMLPLCALLVDDKIEAQEGGLGEDKCHERLLSHLLDGTLAADPDDPGVWVVHPNIGAQVLYASNANVLASNYHRNARGYESYVRLMNAPTDEEAWTLVRQHDLRLLALCKEFAKNSPFMSRVVDESTRPSWMVLREDLIGKKKDLLVFELRRESYP